MDKSITKWDKQLSQLLWPFGAAGIVISREYEEGSLPRLKAAGRAVRRMIAGNNRKSTETQSDDRERFLRHEHTHSA
jgi:hypothetical protein